MATLGDATRRVREGLVRLSFNTLRAAHGFRLNAAERLLIAPQELEPGDPSAAVSFYSGHIMLAGRTVQTRGQSPFLVAPPNPAWARELHGFSWLRHFRSTDNQVVRHHARALVAEWLKMRELRTDRSAQLPSVVARRMQAWLVNAPLLLTDADHGYYNRFMRSLARDAQWLEYCASRRGFGMARLYCAIAYASYTLCALTGENDWKKASQCLSTALGDLVLADGSPVSRNPMDIKRLTIELLQLRTAYTARGRPLPPELQTTLDRLMSLLRLLRHPDGSLALFNGMGSTRLVLLGAVLAFEDSNAVALSAARFGGYHRLARGDGVLIVDTGSAPPPLASEDAHAGALSFEFSTGIERLVVNCGSAPPGLDDLREALRETAAHSTLNIDDASSARFRDVTASDGARLRRLFDTGDRPTVERDGDAGGEAIVITSDSYRKAHNVVHRRTLLLAADGARLVGADVLEAVGKTPPDEALPAILRFHLHPRVRAELLSDGVAVRLELPGGEVWTFEAEDLPVSLEDSIYMGGISSQRRATQILVAMPPPGNEARWSFSRLYRPKS